MGDGAPRGRAGVNDHAVRKAVEYKSARVSGTLMAGLAIFAGCAASDLHMMPTPVLNRDERLDLMPHLRPELRSTSLPGFYATTPAMNTHT